MEKLLSAVAMEVLIKSMAQANPIFSMSCFRLPRGLCECVTSLIHQFWRGSKNGKRKPKNLGGLGFRNMELFNLPLLSRQAWRLLQELGSLIARILKAIYYLDILIIETELGSPPTIFGAPLLMVGILSSTELFVEWAMALQHMYGLTTGYP